jgi:hypothetical protein
MSDLHQFICIIGYGRAPHKGELHWSCIFGITAEGARMPGAANHVRCPRQPHVLYGGSPLEAGRLAIERADRAYDHGRRRRRLRRDGKAILAGVVSYPVLRHVVENDPSEKAVYLRWRDMTLDFLIQDFGAYLKSVVEHADENFLHVHYYAVPELLPDGHLNIRDIHPGARMKRDAAEAGACKKIQDAAYRSGLSSWQDCYWWAVSKVFGHKRFGPKRTRVSRLRRLMERRLEEERARQQTADAADRDRSERELAQRQADVDRDRAKIAAVIQDYERADRVLRAGCLTLKARADAERAGRQAAETEIAALRERVAVLEQTASPRPVA